jgi:protoporphyrinogen oxidase
VLPFEPHSITFDNVVYSVDMPQVITLLEDFVSLMQETSY